MSFNNIIGILNYDGMIIDESIILEIVRPGTGDPVPEGEVGEVVVTLLDNFELPLHHLGLSKKPN